MGSAGAYVNGVSPGALVPVLRVGASLGWVPRDLSGSGDTAYSMLDVTRIQPIGPFPPP
jgi:hypothetical protein